MSVSAAAVRLYEEVGTPEPTVVPHEAWTYGLAALCLFMLALLVTTRLDLTR